jgi:antitoxin ParD1/3/4
MTKFRGKMMKMHQVTISISEQLYEFVENYQSLHKFKSRSEVISAALQLLQQKQLQAYYLEANKELSDDFDTTIADGLDDEAR